MFTDFSVRYFEGEISSAGSEPAVYVLLECGRKAGIGEFYVGQSMYGAGGRYWGKNSKHRDRFLSGDAQTKAFIIESKEKYFDETERLYLESLLCRVKLINNKYLNKKLVTKSSNRTDYWKFEILDKSFKREMEEVSKEIIKMTESYFYSDFNERSFKKDPALKACMSYKLSYEKLYKSWIKNIGKVPSDHYLVSDEGLKNFSLEILYLQSLEYKRNHRSDGRYFSFTKNFVRDLGIALNNDALIKFSYYLFRNQINYKTFELNESERVFSGIIQSEGKKIYETFLEMSF